MKGKIMYAHFDVTDYDAITNQYYYFIGVFEVDSGDGYITYDFRHVKTVEKRMGKLLDVIVPDNLKLKYSKEYVMENWWKLSAGRYADTLSPDDIHWSYYETVEDASYAIYKIY